MKFCPNCGKQLQDNEVCTCQQNTQANRQQFNQQAQYGQGQPQQFNQQAQYGQGQPQQFNQQAQYQQYQPQPMNPTVKAVVDFFAQVFIKPYDAIVNFVKANSVGAAYIILALSAIVTFINNLIYEGGLVIKYNDDWSPRTFQIGSVMKGTGQDIIEIFALASLGAFIFMLITNALDKKENNAQVTFAQAIAAFSLSGIIYDLAQFIAYILRLFNLDFFYKVGDIVTSFAGGFRAMILALVLMLFVKNKNKLPLIYACVAGVNAIASILIGLIFAA